MLMRYMRLLLIAVLFTPGLCAHTADLIIFSKNRPLQLYALLESIDRFMTGINKATLIYCATDEAYAQAYEEVKRAFPNISYIRQSNLPRADFRGHVLKTLRESQTTYILFAVDDNIVKEPVDLAQCIAALESTGAYGFYLRLGTHVHYCYSEGKHQGVPPMVNLGNDIYSWRFDQGCGDWGYPNTVDMTVYRKNDIHEDLSHMGFSSPNTLEGFWSERANRQRAGLCFLNSKIINIPLNLVQTDYTGNRHMGLYSAQQLLEIFNKGLKIDIRPLYGLKNSSAHTEYTPTFIER